MRNRFNTLTLILLAIFLCSCTSEDTTSGSACAQNTKGKYANDAYSEMITDTTISPKISESGECPEAYPVCQGTFCARCQNDDIWVTNDDDISMCMSCKELEDCHSSSCETAKAHCSTQCTPSCHNDIQITCENGKEVKTTCDNGCSDNGQCAVKVECNENEILSESQCICDEAHGWIGKAGDCQCNEADGYKLNGKLCEPPIECDAQKEIYNKTTGTCECNTASHWSGTSGKCVCATGYADILGECVGTGVVCNVPHTIYDPAKDRCVCDPEGHWRGTATGCVCEDGYTEVDGVCQPS